MRYLQWAARHLTGATANCGFWTDRYDVLGWWWDTWRSLAKQFFSDNSSGQLEKFFRETKARNGIQWSKEACARRDDRSTKT